MIKRCKITGVSNLNCAPSENAPIAQDPKTKRFLGFEIPHWFSKVKKHIHSKDLFQQKHPSTAHNLLISTYFLFSILSLYACGPGTNTQVSQSEVKQVAAIASACGGVICKQSSLIQKALGSRSTLVYLVHFNDQSLSSLASKDLIKTQLFEPLSKTLAKFSYGNMSLKNTYTDWTELPISQSTFASALSMDADLSVGLGVLTAEAKRVMTSQMNFNNYTNVVYVFTLRSGNITHCEIGPPQNGAYTQCWLGVTPELLSNSAAVNDELALLTKAWGRSLGLENAHLDSCVDRLTGANQGSCLSAEADDPSDSMGKAQYGGHFNAFHKEQIGWLNTDRTPAITLVDIGVATHQFLLSSYEQATSFGGVKALKILRRSYSDGSQDYYYVEFRNPDKDDLFYIKNKSLNGNLTSGVLIHSGNTLKSDSNYLVDISSVLAPNQNSLVPGIQSALVPGQCFYDSHAADEKGVRIVVNSIDSIGASVVVFIGQAPC